jgi:hypothetical protein
MTRSSFPSADGRRLINPAPSIQRLCAFPPERVLSHPLLTAPIGPSLLRLAGPTTGLMVALGAGRLDDAGALVLHTLVLGVAFALVFTALAWTVAIEARSP